MCYCVYACVLVCVNVLLRVCVCVCMCVCAHVCMCWFLLDMDCLRAGTISVAFFFPPGLALGLVNSKISTLEG